MPAVCVRKLPVYLALLTAVFLGQGTQALANGDPASDVLPSREVFVPADPSLCSAAGRRLDALTEKTGKAGYPIKVAVIPTAEDLGTLFQLFGRPREYARQLARELPPTLFRGPFNKRTKQGGYRLLILMPGRAGIYNAGPAEARALKGVALDTKAGKEDLARSAIGIVAKLSRAAGHRVRTPKPKPACPDIDIGTPSPHSSDSGSGSGGTIVIVVALAAMLALALFLGLRGRGRR